MNEECETKIENIYILICSNREELIERILQLEKFGKKVENPKKQTLKKYTENFDNFELIALIIETILETLKFLFKKLKKIYIKDEIDDKDTIKEIDVFIKNLSLKNL